MRIIVWFSCGAPSAVAAKMAVQRYKNCDIVYCDTGSEHKDNKRFLKDVECWIGQKIVILKNPKYKDIDEVFIKTRYLVGIGGARCTGEMKKKLRYQYQKPSDIHVFGFTIEEVDRAKRFEDNNFDLKISWVLIKKKLTKQDCLSIVNKAGIDIPMMYIMGYKNNNCIGCVKGQKGYWNKIRRDFPEVFDRRSKQERLINVAINKKYVNGERIRVFLDELDPMVGKYEFEADISCGMMCEGFKI